MRIEKCATQKRVFTGAQPCWYPDLRTLASRVMSNTFQLFINHSVLGTLLEQPRGTLLSFHNPRAWGTQCTKPAGVLLGYWETASQAELLPFPSQGKVLLSPLTDQRCSTEGSCCSLSPHLYKVNSKTTR